MKKIIALFCVLLPYFSYSLQNNFNESKKDSIHISHQLDSLRRLIFDGKITADDLSAIIQIQQIYNALNSDSALVYYNREMVLAEQIGDENIIAKVRLKKSIHLWKLVQPDLAAELLQKNISNRNDIVDTVLAKSLFILAKVEIQQKLPSESFLHMVAASEIYIAMNDSINAADCFAYIAGLQTFVLTDYEKSLVYYKKALAYNNYKSESNLISLFVNYSTALLELERFTEAIEKLKKAEYLSKKLNATHYDASIFIQYSLIYNALGEHELSLKHALKADSILAFSPGINAHTKEKVNWYLALNYEALENYDQAFIYFKRLENSYLFDPWEIKSHLINIYKEKGDYEQAFLLQQTLIEAKDSIDEISRTEKLKGVIEKYENEKSQQEILTLSFEKELQKNQIKKQKFILFGIIGVFILLLGFGRYWFKTRIKLKETAQNLEQKELQQRFLRTQLNPHFLFHALTSIEGYIYTHDKEKAANFLRNFSKLMRNILEFSDMDFISLENDIEFIEKFIGLQQLNHDFQFDYFINVSDELDLNEINVPPMLIQPVVENAVLHGALSTDKGVITIDYSKKNNSVEIKISDNGQSFNQTPKTSNKLNRSMSMDITKKRIKNIKEIHGIDILFHSSNNEVGATVVFIIPL